jgi:hypothetical protein
MMGCKKCGCSCNRVFKPAKPDLPPIDTSKFDIDEIEFDREMLLNKLKNQNPVKDGE